MIASALAFAAGVVLCAIVFLARAGILRIAGEAAAPRADSKFRQLVDGLQDTAIWTIDADGRIITWNTAAERLKPFDIAHAAGGHLSQFFSAEDRAQGIPQWILATAAERGIYRSREWRTRRDGTAYFADITVEPVRESDGTLGGFAKIIRDITREKEAEDRLAETSRNLDVALDNMQHGLCLYDADERLVIANDRMAEIYGLPPHELQAGMTYLEVLDFVRRQRGHDEGQMGTAVDIAYRWHRSFMDSGEGGAMTVEYPDGMVLSVSERPLANGGWVSTFEDISERYRSELRLRHMALHDALTDLPNREQFGERAAAELMQAAATGSQVVVLAIDVDHFKDINDRHGHRVADAVLRQIAARIAMATEGEGFAARMGGDEFSVIHKIADECEGSRLGHLLADALAASQPVDGRPIARSASVGLALYPQDGATHEELYANAVLAMYRAKRSGEYRVCRYDSALDDDARQRSALDADLREAVGSDQFRLVYQVQCSVATGETVGYEALLRWHHPRLGLVPPDRFIPIAEGDGLIVPIGEWVLRRACLDAARWSRPHKVAVNISPVQLVQGDLPATITEILLETGLPPSRLEIEITETAIISDKLRALHNLRLIKALGVSVAIDDFGTGYASLDTLHSFEFDKIKIDRSFLTECTHKPQARAIIRAVLALGKSLGLPVLAEGVETAAHLELLRDEECAEAQGFFLGRPGDVVDSESLEIHTVAQG